MVFALIYFLVSVLACGHRARRRCPHYVRRKARVWIQVIAVGTRGRVLSSSEGLWGSD